MKRGPNDSDSLTTESSKKSKTDDRAHSVGLSEFMNHGFLPITGEFKTRVEDFMVTEVYKEDADCRLKSFDIPALPVEERKPETGTLTKLSDEIVSGLNKVISKELSSYSIPSSEDKAERTSLHKSIAAFNDMLSSETTKDGNDSVIKITLKRNIRGNRDNIPGKNNQFLHFTVLKWNVTTSDVVLRLSKQLNIKSKNLSYAGLKDKRGITSQRMCCRYLEPKRLLGLNRLFFDANFASNDDVVYKGNYIMGDFEFSKTGLKLGDLYSNKFSIVLRDCEETTLENLDKIKTSLLANGFINYFGLQRFGNRGDTHEVGKSILMKEYQSAVELILIPNENSKKDVIEALNHYSASGDAQASLNMLNYKHSIEGLILSSLAKEPNDYKRALKTLHHKQQTLYAHAYQSYVWNRLVSLRIRNHGTAVLSGDLVYSDETQGKVRRLSPEEVSSSQLSEVLLPMPGYDVQFPDNCCKDYISDILHQDGMSIDDFKGPLGKEFNVSGCYRNVVYKPSEFDYEVIKYSEENEKLVSTDLDFVLDRSFKVKNEGERVALRLQFTLPRSCYATMLLREIGRTNRF